MLFNALPEFQFHKGTIRTQGFSQGAEVCGISIP